MFNVGIKLGPPLRDWAWPAGLAVLALVPALFGEPARAALRWQRDLLLAEPWRLLTAHLVHLDAAHLAFNLAGLAVVWALVGETLRLRHWTLVAVVGALVISVGLLATTIDWYVGLSGMLHTMLAAGAVALFRSWRLGTIALLAFLVSKGVLEYAGLTSSEMVVVEAHWLGTAAGMGAGVLFVFFRRRQA